MRIERTKNVIRNMDKIYKIVKLSPFISTENMGDYIIKEFCDDALGEIFGNALTVSLPTRERLSKISMKHIGTADYTFVCGTNLLASDMRKTKQWNMHLTDAIAARCGAVHKNEMLHPKIVREKVARTHIILMGVGWHQYQEMPTAYTRHLFQILLDKTYLHSVRDSYTENMLKKIGITNVVNTACPTMWKLDQAHCAAIPQKKADRVITTLTNYNLNRDSDRDLLRMLKQNYKDVYVWLQAIEDYDYLQTLPEYQEGGIQIIEPTLASYTRLLEPGKTDYVGTRLHGGIKALNCGCRSLILAVDNRAAEIAKDTNLPVMNRTDPIEKIEERINASWQTQIVLPEKNIQRWKEQFQ